MPRTKPSKPDKGNRRTVYIRDDLDQRLDGLRDKLDCTRSAAVEWLIENCVHLPKLQQMATALEKVRDLDPTKACVFNPATLSHLQIAQDIARKGLL